MRANIIYILMAAGVLASCSSDQLGEGADALSGNGEKTPIAIETNLSASPISRAYDKTFESGDVLLTYLRHITGETKGAYVSVAADQAPRLVSLTYSGGELVEVDENTKGTDDLTASGGVLYWDDFSNSASAETDLRTDGHGLQSYYGYCFNGGEGTDNAKGNAIKGNISTALTEGTGVLGWSVPVDQSTDATLLTKADLLWSAEQEKVTYAHADKNEGGNHNTITIPYTHAMSKVTINVIAGEGYAAGCLGSTTVQIKDFNTTGTFTAPSQDIEPKASGDVMLFGETETKVTIDAKDLPTRAFTAMTVPHTNLSVSNTLATITDVDGNNYTIPVTQKIIDAWKGQLEESEEEIDNELAQAKGSRAEIPQGKGWITKPGVNYVLNVTIEKTKIKFSASLKDWDYVYAEAEGLIAFEGDVTEKGEIATELQSTGFDVYKNTVNTSFPTKSATMAYTAGKWGYKETPIYWLNKDDNEYFRAIAPMGTTLTALQQGTDYLWGTSAAEDKSGTMEETAIAPRTGGVPLGFEHAMSKITVQLETAEGDASLATCPAVNLTGAQISISNLSTGGSINLVNGAITPSATSENAITLKTTAELTNYCVIPQTIADASIMTIKLADGTTYSLQLNKCVLTGTDTAVNAWAKGQSYTYTIHLEKEKITFRALVKDWDEATGSGNATLEWD
ncbi:MAG: fimbrillin family protein [Prevotella sp.]|nr:fimbrillin family protein [Candidatus Prevotella equi]